MPLSSRKPILVCLPSPSEPLLDPKASLSNYVADYIQRTSPAPSASAPSTRSFISWSAAEVCCLPRIEKPGDQGGDGVRVEKPLFDAFSPFNATLSVALAFLNGSVQELNRSGKIIDFANFLAGDLDDEDDENRPPPSEPFEWDRVGHDTCVGLTKDVVSQTLTRYIERIAKPKLSRKAYAELLKHPHRAARKAYEVARPQSSTMAASYRAGALVASSPTFFSVRALTLWLSEILVDSVAWWRGQMSAETLATNTALKLAKHTVNGLFCIALGSVVPFLSTNFYIFVAVEQLGAAYATDALIAKLGPIEPS